MQLRRYRNTSRPINRLPPELLCRAFSYLRPPPSSFWSVRLVDHYRYDPYRPLTTTLLVCHKWHTIGSQAAPLWTDIDFVRQGAFASVLLTRSLHAKIRLCGHLHKDRTFETTIIDHGARIRELDVTTGAELSDPLPALRSVLAVNMPQLRLLSIFGRRWDSYGQASPFLDHATVSLPGLQAMLLQGFLFVPSRPLPRLTRLFLAWVERINVSNILNLLRATPALEVLTITLYRDPIFERPDGILSTVSSPSVALPRCHSIHIFGFTSTAVHDLMLSLEVPNLSSLSLPSTFANGGTLSSTPLLPRTLTPQTLNRLAFGFDNDGTCFRTVSHGKDVAITMNIIAFDVPEAERRRWAFDEFPTLLQLSGIDEFHFQASQWDAAQSFLCHLAAHMPAVSTLYIAHDTRWHDDDEAGVMALASAVAALLEADNPVLFPHLAHLELVLSAIPQELCTRLASALARHQASLGDGRRLQTLRIRLGEDHLERWAGRWCLDLERPEYEDTGIFDRVDCAEVDPERRACKVHEEGHCPEHARWSACTKGWGQWESPVPGATHDYWR